MSVQSFCHLQSHGDRFKGTQAFLDDIVVESHFLTCCTAQRLVVLEGIACAVAGNQFAFQVHFPNAILDDWGASKIDDDLCILHEQEFFPALLLH